MCLLVFVAGCGDSGITIHGMVTVDGQPLETAEIKFFPLADVNGESIGAAVANGEYEIPSTQRIKEGEYQVQIRSYRSTGKKVWDGMGDGENKVMVDEFRQFLPNRYNDASELKVALKQGDNEFNADLQTRQ